MPTLLIDGFNLTFRSFYGMPELTRADGLHTNAVHGWVRTIWRLIDNEKPDKVISFFDLGGSSRRLEIHPEYKANRGETPEELVPQIPWIKKVTQAMGIPVVESEGIEADDLLASAATQLADKGEEIIIVSADKDFAQCVRPGITQLLPPPTANPKLGWRRMDSEAVHKKFGVTPEQIPSYLALVGDASDNIPGLQGVGPKTAAKWLNEHKDIEAVIAAADEIKPVRFQEKIKESVDLLRMNLDLVRFELDLDYQAHGETSVQLKELVTLLEELEMNRSAKDAVDRYNQVPLL